MSAQLGHVIAGTLYLVCLALVVTPLADSRSFAQLDVSDLSGMLGVNFAQAVQVLGPRYGFGYFQDSNGWKWIDDNNFVGYFGCDDHKRHFNTLKAFTWLSVFFTGFGVIISFLGAGSGSPALGFASLGVAVLYFCVVTIAMAVGWSLWHESYSCNTFTFKIADHSTINYGPIFVTIAFFFSFFIIAVLPILGSLSGAKPVDNEPVAEKEEVAEEKPAESS